LLAFRDFATTGAMTNMRKVGQSAKSVEEAIMTVKRGSAKPGPSKAYVRLLRGKITSEQYTAAVRRSANIKASRRNAAPDS